MTIDEIVSKAKEQNKIMFATFDQVKGLEENGIGGMGGWFDIDNTWEEYLDMFTEEGQEIVKKLREAIVEKKIKCTGQEHQYGAASCPVFPDGTTATYSYRSWGDLMAAIWSVEDKKKYSYMHFYM
jgi:hypothetical protein